MNHKTIDPYLVPGQPCEVWMPTTFKKRHLRYFLNKEGKDLWFSQYPGYESPSETWKHYRPIGTEWDFAPDWALDPKNKDVCSTVDADGELAFWKNCNEASCTAEVNEWAGTSVFVTGFFCPDKSRWQGDAWKTSKRDRPDWVVKKADHISDA